jgi:hypothetical protein
MPKLAPSGRPVCRLAETGLDRTFSRCATIDSSTFSGSRAQPRTCVPWRARRPVQRKLPHRSHRSFSLRPVGLRPEPEPGRPFQRFRDPDPPDHGEKHATQTWPRGSIMIGRRDFGRRYTARQGRCRDRSRQGIAGRPDRVHSESRGRSRGPLWPGVVGRNRQWAVDKGAAGNVVGFIDAQIGIGRLIACFLSYPGL